MKTDIVLRAHTVAPARAKRERKRQRQRAVDRWPQTALVFDTETTTDTEQALTFGSFRCCVLRDDEYRCVEEGLVYADDASSSAHGIST